MLRYIEFISVEHQDISFSIQTAGPSLTEPQTSTSVFVKRTALGQKRLTWEIESNDYVFTTLV